jgi:hypothetical protein
MINFRKLIYIFLFTSLFFLSAISLLNFIIDPNGQYLNKFYFFEDYLSNELIANENIGLRTGSYNDRKFIEYYFSKLKNKPKIIIIGSSISREISSQMLQSNILNLSVSGGSVDDLALISMMSVLDQEKPKKIIFGVDYKMFTNYSDLPRFCALKKYFPAVKYSLNIDLQKKCFFTFSKFENLINSTLTIQSSGQILKFIYHRIFGLSKNINNRVPNLDLIQRDGSQIYGLHFDRSVFVTDLDKENLSKMNEINFDKLNEFNALIKYLNKNQIQVEVYLAPTAPKLWDEDITKNLVSNENIIRNILLACSNVKVIGSFDPNLMKCANSEFYDVGHAKFSCISRIVASEK